MPPWARKLKNQPLTVDLTSSDAHCIFCVISLEEVPQDGRCPRCFAAVISGQLPSGTRHDPLRYTYAQHLYISFSVWWQRIAEVKGTTSLTTVTASGSQTCLFFEDFPARVYVDDPVTDGPQIASRTKVEAVRKVSLAGCVSIPQGQSSSSTDAASIHVPSGSATSQNETSPIGATTASSSTQASGTQPASRSLQQHDSDENVTVWILQMSRHTGDYKEAMTLKGTSAGLQRVLSDLESSGYVASESQGPRVFARPHIVEAVRRHLGVNPCNIGRQSLRWDGLKYWHIVVEQQFLDEVLTVLRNLPASNNEHIRHATPIALRRPNINDESDPGILATTMAARLDARIESCPWIEASTMVHVAPPPSSLWSHNSRLTVSDTQMQSNAPNHRRARIDRTRSPRRQARTQSLGVESSPASSVRTQSQLQSQATSENQSQSLSLSMMARLGDMNMDDREQAAGAEGDEGAADPED